MKILDSYENINSRKLGIEGKMKEIHTILDEIIAAAKECGQVMLAADRSKIGIKDKAGKANFVTRYDCKIQEMLQVKLAQILPEAEFFGEEEDCQIDRNAEYIFVVDPIDGTTNFINGLQYAVSVALVYEQPDHILLGVVYNPKDDIWYYACKGKGSYILEKGMVTQLRVRTFPPGY